MILSKLYVWTAKRLQAAFPADGTDVVSAAGCNEVVVLGMGHVPPLEGDPRIVERPLLLPDLVRQRRNLIDALEQLMPDVEAYHRVDRGDRSRFAFELARAALEQTRAP